MTSPREQRERGEVGAPAPGEGRPFITTPRITLSPETRAVLLRLAQDPHGAGLRRARLARLLLIAQKSDGALPVSRLSRSTGLGPGAAVRYLARHRALLRGLLSYDKLPARQRSHPNRPRFPPPDDRPDFSTDLSALNRLAGDPAEHPLTRLRARAVLAAGGKPESTPSAPAIAARLGINIIFFRRSLQLYRDEGVSGLLPNGPLRPSGEVRTGRSERRLRALPKSMISLAAAAPAVAREWHPEKNGALTPERVSWKSKMFIWWKCPKGPDHVWREKPWRRTQEHSGCPCCSNRRFSVTNSLAVRFPALAAQWHPARNGPLTPETVMGSGEKLRWWRCPRGHEWQASLHIRLGNKPPTSCPFCTGKRATPETSLAARFPALAAQWHPTKNGGLTPEQVLPGSGRKAWWRGCPKNPRHEWYSTILNRTGQKTGCAICKGKQVDDTNSLAKLHPALAAQWDRRRNGTLTPDRVSAGSGKQAWWRCRKGHVWRSQVYNRALKHPQPGCPFCSGRRLADSDRLTTANPRLAAQWHTGLNAGLNPRELSIHSYKSVWWRCPKNRKHVWRDTVFRRAAEEAGCPECG
jgi:hypothetical protein